MAWKRRQQETAVARLNESGAALGGAWTIDGIPAVEFLLVSQQFAGTGPFRFNLGGVSAFDSAGALLLHRLRQRLNATGRTVIFEGMSPEAHALLELVAKHAPDAPVPTQETKPGLMEEIGRNAAGLMTQAVDFLSFVGHIAVTAAQVLRHPKRMRLKMTLRHLEHAGYRALPIVGLLAFLLGIVIAYQGGVQLRKYGAGLFIADLVGVSMLRELAPLIGAVIVAGRTGSAYTAEIGTMKVSDEIDALRTMGVNPIELLVLPKVIALVIALPLLTVYADAMGLLGGMVIASSIIGVSPAVFVERIGESVSLSSYLVGIGKAPVFAAIIAAVGCFQGFRVADSAGSVGRHTTTSVVQSIFLVIVVDAAFSVLFSETDL